MEQRIDSKARCAMGQLYTKLADDGHAARWVNNLPDGGKAGRDAAR